MTNFSLAIFGKNLIDLTYQDISDFFIDEHSESENIEFKAFHPNHGKFNTNLKGIIRAVCGLLNSNGGIVIWGAPLGIEDPNTKEKKFYGSLTPLSEYKEKDWIISKISDNIIPLPIGIKVQVLQQNPTENLYIFEVQPSPYKPHQFENIYLVRLDGQTKPAPHYFVEALFRRISYPNIEGYIKFDKVSIIQNPLRYIVDLTILIFNFSRLQNEENIIYRLITYPGVFTNQNQTQDLGTYTGKEELLHFGTPMMNSKRIFISDQELTKNNYQINIVLTIGGKKSPVKSSEYTLDLNKVNLEILQDVNSLIVSMIENQLLSDKQDQLGTTREISVSTILGRRPGALLDTKTKN